MSKDFHNPRARTNKRLACNPILALLLCFGIVLGAAPGAEAARAKNPPPAPESLLAVAADQNRIDLNWSYSGEGITGFSVERSLNASSGFSEIAITGDNVLSLSDTGLAPSQTWYYRVRAYTKKGKNISFSPYGTIAKATTESPAPAPVPGSFEFDLSAYSVGESDGSVNVTIKRVGGSDGVATVDWKTQGVTATYAADYGNFDWTTLTFADGETSKVKSVAITSDTTAEGDEVFNVQLGNPTGGATLGAVTTAAVTIDDDDIAPVPVPGSFEFALSAYSAGESDGSVNVTIKRVGGSDGVATVDWRTQGVTATFDADYGSFDWTTLTFADGETSKVKSIAIVGDSLIEEDETFKLLLGNPTGGATLGAITTSVVMIQDDSEPAPTPSAGTFELASSSYSVAEGGNSAQITIKRVGGSAGVATIDWKTQGVTATFDADYGSFDWTTLTFADGETSKVKNISIVQDNIFEGNESFNVLLGNTTGGATLGATSEATVTIIDDDEEGTSPPPPQVGYLPVFPGAQGFGTETKAGRGGKVIKVTNLNDSGTGSLRAAIQASGPRIIVFEVSGNIPLDNNLVIKNPYITIAGQTAPSPGITLKGAGFEVRSHDVLIQHLRVRPGDGPVGPAPLYRDGLVVYGPNGYNVVLDHASISWTVDKGTSNWGDGVKDVTISNTIVSEALHNSINPQGAHSMGSLVGDHGKNIAFIGNLWAHNRDRNPAMKGNATSVIVNNLMYDAGPWAFMYMSDDFNAGPSKISLAGNVLIEGPSSDTTIGLVVQSSVTSGSQIYLSDNSYTGGNSFFANKTGFDPRTSSPPVWHESLSVEKSSTVEAKVLANAGARPADRDSIDDRIVNEVKSRTGDIIDSQQQVGGWPSLSKNTRTFNVPTNPNGDDDGDGYTNIEEVLHQMAAQVERI